MGCFVCQPHSEKFKMNEGGELFEWESKQFTPDLKGDFWLNIITTNILLHHNEKLPATTSKWNLHSQLISIIVFRVHAKKQWPLLDCLSIHTFSIGVLVPLLSSSVHLQSFSGSCLICPELSIHFTISWFLIPDILGQSHWWIMLGHWRPIFVIEFSDKQIKKLANGGHFWWSWQAISQAIKTWHLIENTRSLSSGFPPDSHQNKLIYNVFRQIVHARFPLGNDRGDEHQGHKLLLY